MVIAQLIVVQPQQLPSRSIINGTWATLVSCLESYLPILWQLATSPQPCIPIEMVILIDILERVIHVGTIEKLCTSCRKTKSCINRGEEHVNTSIELHANKSWQACKKSNHQSQACKKSRHTFNVILYVVTKLSHQPNTHEKRSRPLSHQGKKRLIGYLQRIIAIQPQWHKNKNS